MEIVKLREKIAYGFGDAASSIFWKLFTMYLLFFYTDVVGLNALAVGTMIFITRLWDSFLDPVIGIMADRTKTKWGKFRPYLLWMALPFGIAGVLTFTTPSLNDSGKLIYAYLSYSVMMVIYSLINVPYASLLGVMTSDTKIRTELSSYRMIFAFIGSILVLLLVEPLVDFFSKRDGDNINLQFGWQMAITVFSVITVILFLLCFKWTRERVKPIKEKSNSIKSDIVDLLKNGPWWILLGAGIMTLMFNSIRDGVAIYYFKYCVIDAPIFHFARIDTNLTLITIYLVLGQIANILGIIMVTPISAKIGKKHTYLLAMSLASLLSILFFFLGYSNISLILLMQILISICAGMVTPLLWSMYADTADYSEWKTGRRATGLVFSASSMSQKLGGALGVSIVGWLLAFFSYASGMVQSADTQFGIKLMISLLPAFAAFLSVIFIAFYPLSKKKLENISNELDVRRKS